MRRAFLILALAAIAATSCMKSECRRDAIVPWGGDYALVNNEHGRWRLTNEDTYDQCVWLDDSGFPVGWRWTCNTNQPGVKGYPQILCGTNPWSRTPTTDKLPVYVGDIAGLTVQRDASISGGGVYNVCFDMFFVKSAPAESVFSGGRATKSIRVPDVSPEGIVLELMVWLENTATPLVGEKVGVMETADNAWQVYYATAPDRSPLLMFVAVRPPLGDVTDFVPFLEWAQKRGYLARDSYLACLEYGTEITRGNGVARVDGYRVEVITREDGVGRAEDFLERFDADSVDFSGYPPTSIEFPKRPYGFPPGVDVESIAVRPSAQVRP